VRSDQAALDQARDVTCRNCPATIRDTGGGSNYASRVSAACPIDPNCAASDNGPILPVPPVAEGIRFGQSPDRGPEECWALSRKSRASSPVVTHTTPDSLLGRSKAPRADDRDRGLSRVYLLVLRPREPCAHARPAGGCPRGPVRCAGWRDTEGRQADDRTRCHPLGRVGPVAGAAPQRDATLLRATRPTRCSLSA